MVVMNESDIPSTYVVFLMSLLAKFAATIITYPILTLKTKTFTETSSDSTLTVFVKFIKKEGLFALYRGLYAKLFQTLLYNSFMMMAFEKIKYFVQITFQ